MGREIKHGCSIQETTRGERKRSEEKLELHIKSMASSASLQATILATNKAVKSVSPRLFNHK
jgi:hypothetical protein